MARLCAFAWIIAEMFLELVRHCLPIIGVLRRVFVPFLRFLRKDFHPWQHDNRHLIDTWTGEQSTGSDPEPPATAA